MRRVLASVAAGVLLGSGAAVLPGIITVRASAPVSLTGVSPNAGPKAGGIPVILSGSGFQGGANVKFGVVSATVISVNPNQITATLPAQPSFFGSVLVEVDNPDGGTAILPAAFNYYEPLPAGQLTAAAATAIYGDPGTGNERLDVFGRGTDNVLYHTYQDASAHWTAWESLGGILASGPAVASWGRGRLDVFVRGVDNVLYHKWWDGHRWSGYESLGGSLTSAPAVSSWSSGRLDVFVRGTDNALWHKWYDGSWKGFESLGGTLTSDPGAASWGPNRIDVFVRGTDNALWHKWYDGTRWKEFESLGGTLTSAPGATSSTEGVLEVLGLGTSSKVFYNPYSNTWLGFIGEGPYWSGSWAFGPGVVAQGSFTLGVEVFEVADDGSVWHTNLPSASDLGAMAPTRSPAGRRSGPQHR